MIVCICDDPSVAILVWLFMCGGDLSVTAHFLSERLRVKPLSKKD